MPSVAPLPAEAPSGAPGEASPWAAGFSHDRESATPGRYQVDLDAADGQRIGVDLAAGTRVGIGRFTYPAGGDATVVLDAGRRADGALRATSTSIPRPVRSPGSITSRTFCRVASVSTVYVVVTPDRAPTATGTWADGQWSTATDASDEGGTTADSESAQPGPGCGFTPAADGSVTLRTAVSYVSVDGARANLAAEDPTDVDAVAAATRAEWNRRLGAVHADGPPSPRSARCTRRSTTRCSDRERSATSTAATSGGTASRRWPTGGPPAAGSPAGTRTAARSRCSPCWRRTSPPTRRGRCSRRGADGVGAGLDPRDQPPRRHARRRRHGRARPGRGLRAADRPGRRPGRRAGERLSASLRGGLRAPGLGAGGAGRAVRLGLDHPGVRARRLRRGPARPGGRAAGGRGGARRQVDAVAVGLGPAGAPARGSRRRDGALVPSGLRPSRASPRDRPRSTPGSSPRTPTPWPRPSVAARPQPRGSRTSSHASTTAPA